MAELSGNKSISSSFNTGIYHMKLDTLEILKTYIAVEIKCPWMNKQLDRYIWENI